jgi:hypothetical protein
MVPNTLSKIRRRVVATLQTALPRLCVALERAHVALHPELPTPAQLLKKARKKHKGKGKDGAAAAPAAAPASVVEGVSGLCACACVCVLLLLCLYLAVHLVVCVSYRVPALL